MRGFCRVQKGKQGLLLLSDHQLPVAELTLPAFGLALFQFQYQWHFIALVVGKDLYLEIVECMVWKE